MSLVVITGAARSGKSGAAERLAAARGRPVTVAVGTRVEDPEMERRVASHRVSRPAEFAVIEVGADPAWLLDVPSDGVLVVECLGTLVGSIVSEAVSGEELADAREERAAQERTDALVDAILARAGDTIVVSNETGWGPVPAYPSGRVFRDVLGRATRRLVDGADSACLMVAGRCVELETLPDGPHWPGDDDDDDGDDERDA